MSGGDSGVVDCVSLDADTSNCGDALVFGVDSRAVFVSVVSIGFVVMAVSKAAVGCVIDSDGVDVRAGCVPMGGGFPGIIAGCVPMGGGPRAG